MGNLSKAETLRIHSLSSLMFKPVVEKISTSKEDEFAEKMKKAFESEKASALHGIDQYAQSSHHGGHHPGENARSQSPLSTTDEAASNDNVGGSNSTVKKIDVLI